MTLCLAAHRPALAWYWELVNFIRKELDTRSIPLPDDKEIEGKKMAVFSAGFTLKTRDRPPKWVNVTFVNKTLRGSPVIDPGKQQIVV